MIDYKLGKIYKIISNYTNKIYIGNTCLKSLYLRLKEHKKSYKNGLMTNKNLILLLMKY